MSKEAYIHYCNKNEVPLFAYPWWLDTVAGTNWDVAYTKYKDTEIFWPYCYHQKLIIKKAYQQSLTPYLGPVFVNNFEDEYSKRQHEIDCISAICKAMPKFIDFRQKLYPHLDNYLPFFWEKYKQTTKYTYIIDTIENEDILFKNLKENQKRKVRKVEKNFVIEQCTDIDTIWKLSRSSLDRQETDFIPSDEYVKNLHHELMTRERFISWVVMHEDHPIASIYMVFDAFSVYYLFGGFEEDYRDSGAMTALLWKAIQFSKSKNLPLNFEGSMHKGIEKFFRSFGARLTPVNFIWK